MGHLGTELDRGLGVKVIFDLYCIFCYDKKSLYSCKSGDTRLSHSLVFCITARGRLGMPSSRSAHNQE